MSCLHGGTHHQSGIEFTFALHSIKTFSIFFFQSEREIRARTFQFELSEPAGPGGETETEPKNADDGSSPWREMKQPKHGELLLELSRIGVGALYEWEERDNESMRTPAGGLPSERVD